MDDGFRDQSSRDDDEPLTLVTDGSRTNRTKWARLDALIDPECVLYVGYLGDHVVHIRREDEGEPNFHLDFTGDQIHLVKLKYRRLQPPVPVSEADFILFMDDYMADSDADVYRFFKHGERAVVEDDRPLNERWLERFMRGVDQDTHLLQRKIGDDMVDFIRLRPAVNQRTYANGTVRVEGVDILWSFRVKVYEHHIEVVNINSRNLTPVIAVYADNIYEFLAADHMDAEVFFRQCAALPPPSRGNPFSVSSGSRNPMRRGDFPQRGENPGHDDVEVVRYRNPPGGIKHNRTLIHFNEPESSDRQNPRWSEPAGVGNPSGTAAALLLERLMDLQLTWRGW